MAWRVFRSMHAKHTVVSTTSTPDYLFIVAKRETSPKEIPSFSQMETLFFPKRYRLTRTVTLRQKPHTFAPPALDAGAVVNRNCSLVHYQRLSSRLVMIG